VALESSRYDVMMRADLVRRGQCPPAVKPISSFQEIHEQLQVSLRSSLGFECEISNLSEQIFRAVVAHHQPPWSPQPEISKTFMELFLSGYDEPENDLFELLIQVSGKNEHELSDPPLVCCGAATITYVSPWLAR
jgi:hypothetical protein